MSSERFYTGFSTAWLWVLAIGNAAFTAYEIRLYADGESPVTLMTALGFAGMARGSALSLRNLRRPVVEVSDEAIVYGPIGGFRRKRIPPREVEAIEVSKPRRVVLRMRSGKRAKVRLRYVAKAQRAAAREAIERRVAALDA